MSEEEEFRDRFCYCCNREYASNVGTFSDSWTCSACGAPICSLCWSTGLRYCDEHTPRPDDKTERDSSETGEVPRAKPIDESTAEKRSEYEEEPSKEAKGSGAGEAGSKPETETGPEISSDEIPEGTLSRKECKNREESFLSRVESRFGNRFGVYHPLEEQWVEMTKKNLEIRKRQKSEQIKTEIQSHHSGDYRKIYRNMPLDRQVRWDVFTRKFFGGRALKVVLGAASVSPWNELAATGYSDREMPYARAEDVVEEMTAGSHVFHYIAVFAPTGWKKEARDLVSSGRNYLLTLVEYRDGSWHSYSSPDSRWGDFEAVFELNTKEERKQMIIDYIKDREAEVILGQLTVDKASEDLDISESVLEDMFRRIASQDPFVRFEVTRSDSRLVRTYDF